MDDLIERLEKATGPDRELDAILHQALFPELADAFPTDSGWLVGGKHAFPTLCPSYTASLDIAIALVERVLPGWVIDHLGDDYMAGTNGLLLLGCTAEITANGRDMVQGQARTRPIALLIALLRASEKKVASDG